MTSNPPWVLAQKIIELISLLDRLATTDDLAEMRAIIDQIKVLVEAPR